MEKHTHTTQKNGKSAVTLKSHSYLNENNQPDLQVHLCLKCHFCPQREGNNQVLY